MVNTSFCDLDPLVIRGRNLSLARPQANIDFTIGYVCFGFVFDLMCLAAWFLLKNRYERTRVRPTAFVVIAALASLCQMGYGSMQTIVNDSYPCWLGPVLLVAAIPLAAVSVIGRLILFGFLSQLSATVSDKLKNRDVSDLLSSSSTEDSMLPTIPVVRRAWLILKRIGNPTGKVNNDAELVVLKFLITTRGVLTMVLTFSIPVVLIVVIFLFQSSSANVYRYCTNCNISTEVSTLTIVFMVLFWVKGMVDALLMLRKFDTEDSWGLKKECFTSLLAVVVIILAFVLTTFDRSKIYPYSHMFMLSVGLWMLVASQSIWQLYLARNAGRSLQKHSDEATAKIDAEMLQRVVRDPTLGAKFESHLIAEFAVESLYFLKDIATWQNSYYSIAPNARLARARKIYRNYVATTGLYSINISSEVNAQIKSATMQDDHQDIAYNTFDAAMGEITTMLIGGALIRFYQSEMAPSTKGMLSTKVGDMDTEASVHQSTKGSFNTLM